MAKRGVRKASKSKKKAAPKKSRTARKSSKPIVKKKSRRAKTKTVAKKSTKEKRATKKKTVKKGTARFSTPMSTSGIFHPPHKCQRTPNGCLMFFPDKDGEYLLPPGGKAVDCSECLYWL